MKQFKVGDQVQKIGAVVPGCPRDGVVVAIKLENAVTRNDSGHLVTAQEVSTAQKRQTNYH
jgi:hypothetical protein